MEEKKFKINSNTIPKIKIQENVDKNTKNNFNETDDLSFNKENESFLNDDKPLQSTFENNYHEEINVEEENFNDKKQKNNFNKKTNSNNSKPGMSKKITIISIFIVVIVIILITGISKLAGCSTSNASLKDGDTIPAIIHGAKWSSSNQSNDEVVEKDKVKLKNGDEAVLYITESKAQDGWSIDSIRIDLLNEDGVKTSKINWEITFNGKTIEMNKTLTSVGAGSQSNKHKSYAYYGIAGPIVKDIIDFAANKNKAQISLHTDSDTYNCSVVTGEVLGTICISDSTQSLSSTYFESEYYSYNDNDINIDSQAEKASKTISYDPTTTLTITKNNENLNISIKALNSQESNKQYDLYLKNKETGETIQKISNEPISQEGNGYVQQNEESSATFSSLCGTDKPGTKLSIIDKSKGSDEEIAVINVY